MQIHKYKLSKNDLWYSNPLYLTFLKGAQIWNIYSTKYINKNTHIPKIWAKPETKNWYRFKNFLIYVRLPLFEYCSIGPSLLSLSVSKSVLHDQWDLLSLSEYPTLSEIYIQEIGRHYRLARIFFLVPNLLSLVIEIKKQDIKIDGQNSDNSACFLK